MAQPLVRPYVSVRVSHGGAELCPGSVASTVRFCCLTATGSSPCRTRDLHHQAAKGRTRSAGMASRDGGPGPGGGKERPDNDGADRCDASAEPASRPQRYALGKAEAEERRRLRPASISIVRLDSMCRNRRIARFILALALAIVGALGAIYVLFFAAGGHYITAVTSSLILGVGLIWLSDLIDARSP
jgi:hypothetical protein